MREISWFVAAAVLSACSFNMAGASTAPRDPVANVSRWLALPERERSLDTAAMRAPLDKAASQRVLGLLTADRMRTLARERQDEMTRRSIVLGDKVLRWEERTFGTAPANGRSLWISMHGGGNAPASLNDQQWRNQIRLYTQAEGVYVAPRAPTDTWNLWHEDHIDPMFQRLIDDQVAINGVNPDKVYLMGYSAGGDGVWQLAPRMADRFAAAAMMAGHPNDASLLPLRNLPFAIFMGGNDSGFGRNTVAAAKGADLDRLQQADPSGYPHMVRIYPGLGHWMDRRDGEALPWMASFSRRNWPARLVWVRGHAVADRFYWLGFADSAAAGLGDRIDAAVAGQTIAIAGDVRGKLILRLSDALLDLDRPVTVVVNGKRVWRGVVPRTAAAIQRSLLERADPGTAALALLEVG